MIYITAGVCWAMSQLGEHMWKFLPKAANTLRCFSIAISFYNCLEIIQKH